MNPDYEGLVSHMKGLSAIPLVVIYAKEDGGVELNYFTTPAYDDADATLKADIKSTVERVVGDLK